MSVTVTLVPLALLNLAVPAAVTAVASLTAAAAGANTERRKQRRMLDELTRQSQAQDELARLMFPNLYASRQSRDAEQPSDAECVQAAREAMQNAVEPPRAFTRQTLIQDLDLARQTAESLGGRLLSIAEGVAFLYKDCGFVLFRPEESVAYELWILGTTEAETAATLAEAIETEYKRLVRDRVHEALLQHSARFGLALESEEIQEDRSIVLTFTV